MEFVHNALPEIDFEEVDTSTTFLGRVIGMPLLISSMTGGYADALRLNRGLAEACQSLALPMGVGSQRQALENATFHRTFSVVREAAPDIPLAGNLGAAEVASLTSPDPVLRLAELIRADAFIVHLNPLQELLQPEGNPRFRGVLQGIAALARALPIPVIVKEIGAGLSPSVVRRLLDAGVRHIDIAGAGGTSWAGVEVLRRSDRQSPARFWDWGIPTADAVRGAAALKSAVRPFTLIASGGIANGIDVAKCIALGADLAASARPLLGTLERGGPRALIRLLETWRQELRSAMFLTGSTTLRDLQRAEIVPAP
jgi:isopentenyl-diphosphate delta-isomerase